MGADCLLLEGYDIKVDESDITGELVHVIKTNSQ